MNPKLIFLITVILIVVGAFLIMKKNPPSQSRPIATPSPVTAQHLVSIQNMSFLPGTITIKAGESVTWSNQDAVGHSATADDNSFDTGVLSTDQSKSVTFNKTGTFTYHCKVHPSMTGTVIVQ